MKSFSNFTMILATAIVISAEVASFGGVKKREFMVSPHIEHLLRALVAPGDCDGAAAGEKVTDPDDCMKFFVCIAPGEMTADSFPCSDIDTSFECFDNAAGNCSDNASGECDTACAPKPSKCKTECGNLDDQIADITDCKRHYLCLGADPGADTILIDCPADMPYFDGAKCGTDKSACCNCQPGTCTAAGDQIADPQDCHSYFICVDADGSGTLTPLPNLCDGGGSFVNGACDSSTTECDAVCDLGDTTTSTQSTATSYISTHASSLSTSVPTLSTPASTLSTSIDSSSLTSTTSASTSTSTSTPTTTPGCIDSSDFTCPGHGFYPRCPFCDPSYFSCDGIGGSPTQGDCSGDLVFNPTPDYPFCVLPGNCPLS